MDEINELRQFVLKLKQETNSKLFTEHRNWLVGCLERDIAKFDTMNAALDAVLVELEMNVLQFERFRKDCSKTVNSSAFKQYKELSK